MLQAFAKVKAVHPSFFLNLVGPMPTAIKELITQLNLQENVVVHGAKTNAEVAAIMQHSDVFVFFTRYETFGCVIIEANACGLPVIVTNLEVTRALIKHNGNGLLVENENTSDLAEKILYSIHHLPSFDSATIAAATKNAFNLQKIGKAFKLWYETCL